MRIGLFDSGVGGLTVLKTLSKKYPNNHYIYYGDTLNNPYGNKTKDELLTLAKANIEFLLSKDVEMIIIACGTVSSNCLNELKKIYQIPIYSILEPTIDYLNEIACQHIGVIATEATINSHIFKDKVDKDVIEIATPKLVPLIESNNLNNISEVLKEYLVDYIDKIDVLVLGCTHYPIIKDEIKKIMGSTLILDMSELINIDEGNEKEIKIYFSKLNEIIISNTKRIIDFDSKTIIKSSNKD